MVSKIEEILEGVVPLKPKEEKISENSEQYTIILHSSQVRGGPTGAFGFATVTRHKSAASEVKMWSYDSNG